MSDSQKIKWFYGISALMIALGCYCIASQQFWIALLPVAALIGYLLLFKQDALLLLVVFSTPLALQLEEIGMGYSISVPSEPLIAIMMLLFYFNLLLKGDFDRKILNHPLTIAIIINMVWMLVTCITSTMVLVSLKHFTARLWFITVCYFLGTQLFKELHNIKKFIWCYTSALFIVVIYTIVRHAQNGFTQKSGHWVMYPFYNDHTAYAAALALMLPPMIYFFTQRKISRDGILAGVMVIVLTTAIVLSYTRAAWISLIAALLIWIVFKLKIKFTTLAITGSILLFLFLQFQTDIFIKLEKNRQQSATDFNTHIQSISNISTDASNLERINRWNSALRMFKEKPFFGWGPNTYQFKYAPYQLSKEMTIISTNFGDGGNAHSEYIGPLTESGVFGALSVIAMIVVMITRATLFYSRCKINEIKNLTLTILLSLITYFVHGMLNNFLDTDKAAVPVFGFMAMLVALEVYHSNNTTYQPNTL